MTFIMTIRTMTFMVGLTEFITPKCQRVIRGRLDLFYEPKDMFGLFDLVYHSKDHRVMRGRRDLLYDPKGHGDLFGRFELVVTPKGHRVICVDCNLFLP